MNSDIDSRHACCCGPFRMSVETGTMVVSVLGMLLELALAIVFFVVVKYYLYAPLSGSVHLVVATLYAMVLYAQYAKKPTLFLPYLILTAVILVFGSLAYYVGVLIEMLDLEEQYDVNEAKQARLFFIAHAIVTGIGTALNAWFYAIAYRTYKLSKEALSSGRVPPSV